MRKAAVSAPAPPPPRRRLLLAGTLLAIIALALIAIRVQWSAAKEKERQDRQAAAHRQERLRQFVQAGRILVAQTPNDPVAHIRLARACALAGQNDEAAQQA